MKRPSLLSITTFILFNALTAQPAFAATTEQRIERLEKIVSELQESLSQAKAEIAKEKSSHKGKLVRTDGQEDIVVSTTGGGIKIKSSNGSSFKFGGRLMYDFASFDDVFASNGKSQDKSEWRRARLTASGSVAKDWSYKFTLNINDAADSSDLNTGYIKYSGFKPFAITVGKFKEPFGLERLTSSKWIPVTERSLITDIVLASGQPDTGGIMFSGYHKDMQNMVWAIGVFDNDIEDGDGDHSYAVTGRLALTPVFKKNHFAHIGIAYSTRDLEGGSYKLRTRMGAHTTDSLDLINTCADDVDEYNLALAYVRGPFSLQSEYLNTNSDAANTCATIDADGKTRTPPNGDVDSDVWYLQGTWTLTGETRGYNKKNAAFDRLKPASPWGAWEVVLRYEDAEIDADYNPQDVEVDKTVFGLNWYPNNNLKFMANYIKADTHNIPIPRGDADGDAFTMRAQYVW